jgi:hypothetical protein
MIKCRRAIQGCTTSEPVAGEAGVCVDRKAQLSKDNVQLGKP